MKYPVNANIASLVTIPSIPQNCGSTGFANWFISFSIQEIYTALLFFSDNVLDAGVTTMHKTNSWSPEATVLVQEADRTSCNLG